MKKAYSKQVVTKKKNSSSNKPAEKKLKTEPLIPTKPVEKYKNKSKLLEKSLRVSRSNSKDSQQQEIGGGLGGERGTQRSRKQKKFKKRSDKRSRRNNSININNQHKIKPDVLASLLSTAPPVRPVCHIDYGKLNLTEAELQLFDSLVTHELDPNGGAYTLVAYQADLDSRLVLDGHETKRQLMEKFAVYFLNRIYSESELYAAEKLVARNEAGQKEGEEEDESASLKENQRPEVEAKLSNQAHQCNSNLVANYVLGVVRSSARCIPDIIDFFAERYPNMVVKSSLLLNSKEITTLKISDYQKQVNATFVNGTYRYGPLLQTSLVGIRNEEIGDYFPDFIRYLEENPFLRHVTPWGDYSINANMSPMNSDDGPIIWCRPGEQFIPTSSSSSNFKDHLLSGANVLENGTAAAAEKRRRKTNLDVLRLSAYYGRVNGPREILFEDRTKPHADNAGNGLETTAAVGVLKAVHGGQPRVHNLDRIVKDVVCFHADDYEKVIDFLKLDVFEPPVSQVYILFEKNKITRTDFQL